MPVSQHCKLKLYHFKLSLREITEQNYLDILAVCQLKFSIVDSGVVIKCEVALVSTIKLSRCGSAQSEVTLWNVSRRVDVFGRVFSMDSDCSTDSESIPIIFISGGSYRVVY